MGERQASQRLRQILGRFALRAASGAGDQVIGADLLGPQLDRNRLTRPW
jgi:hypothetical protein